MKFGRPHCTRNLEIADIKLLSNQPIPNAPVSPLIHWRANDAADREQAKKAIESYKP